MSIAREHAQLIAATIMAAQGKTLEELLERYREDPRRTVQQAIARVHAQRERREAERSRVALLYERAWKLGGTGFVLGVDEVGRGALAGPLTVGAVALPANPHILGLDDSKRLRAARREVLAAQIQKEALAVGIAHVPPGRIDRYGMAWALREGVRQAIVLAEQGYGKEPSAVLIDGRSLNVHPREIAVVHGDAKLAPVAAASIVAKVARDALLQKAETIWPNYPFASCKGYGSSAHLSAIAEHGLTPYHRITFCQRFTCNTDQPKLF